MFLKYTVEKENNYNTVREIINNEFKISSRLLTKLKKDKRILLNDTSTYIDRKIAIGDTISINIAFEEDNSNIVSTKISLNVLYEDDYYLVINKPAAIPVHPSILHYDDSLSNGVKYYFDNINLKRKIRPVNRLDKNTSGIVIFAKNEYIQESLVKQMINRTFYKEYIGIVDGILNTKIGTINAPIARKQDSIIERCISENGSYSITHYEVLKELDNISIVKFKLETGRTHQIRVHSSYIGHPIIGDTLYGKESHLINRQALHAYKVNFIHPIFKKNVEYIAPIPEDMLFQNHIKIE